ncbi:F-box/LRR-repeat protein 7-like isoform X2 [Ornithodoros turicata]|uniref:F-box/LRR-repeat protein 7-like isoform X2 n=1 Tax=Ornithodoros turicata TaxID=34597 RepID=UPI0031397BC2
MTAFDANGLPDVVLLKIFKLLKFSDLCKAGRVCQRWYDLSRSQALWTSIDASDPEITASQMEQLAGLLTPSVQRLHVTSSPRHCRLFLTANALRDLRRRCPFLSTLIVDNASLAVLNDYSSITVADLPPTLRTLSLRRSFFQADRFFALLAVQNLSVLDLSFCWCVSESDIPFLTQLPNLHELYLEQCEAIRDTGIALMVSHGRNLRILAVDGTRITDEALRTIAENCTVLEKLYFGRTAVTDVGVSYLCTKGGHLPLRELCLLQTCVSPEAAKSLLATFPHLGWFNFDQPVDRTRRFSVRRRPWEFWEICNHFLRNSVVPNQHSVSAHCRCLQLRMTFRFYPEQQ